MPKYVVFLVVIATLFLCIRYLFFTFAQQPLPTDTLISVVGTVSTSPKIKQNTQSFFLRVQQYREVYVTLSSYPRYHYGERLVVKGKVKKTTFEDGSVFFSLGYPLVESAQTQNYFFLVRKAILSKFERVIPPDDARLLLGIVLGMKEPLSEDFHHAIQETGLLHVVAASGMNVSLVAGGLVFIIGAVLSRRKTLSITLFCLTLYAALSGLEPSIVRASLMGSLLLIAGLVGRQYLGLWMLLLTGYGMLFVDPRLLFDVGFQLSFLATAGIVLIKPLLLIPLPQILSVVREDFSTTLSAQILTIPILLSTFGQFNLISILANVAILWMILPVMVLGGLGVIASFFFEPVMIVFIYLCLPFLWLFRVMVQFFAQFPLMFAEENVSVIILSMYYVVVFWVVFLVHGRKNHHV